MPVILARIKRLRFRRSQFEACPGKCFVRPPISKITRGKWTGGMFQTIECPVCKFKLSPTSEREKYLMK
jgi:hypothetical protein